MKSQKMGAFLFFLLAITCVGAVLGMIISKNQAYNALFLVLAFASLGGLFGLLDAPFIAAVQIIVYAGAIMVLFIFVIMMINLRQGIAPEKKKWTLFLSAGLAVLLLVELLLAIRGTFSSLGRLGGEKIGTPTELGRLLFTDYLYPFEITSILIIAALVGAIVLVKKREKD
jgi:NADH-quinone oxidoreductase subunit J